MKLVDKTCEICDIGFQVEPYRNNTARFCSRICGNRFLGNKKIGTHLSEATKKKISDVQTVGKKSISCKTCNLSFKIKKCEEGKRVYCSWPCYWVSKKGITSWNKGLKLSSEHLAKISGENASNWQGGISTENEIMRKRKEYRLWREAVFSRDNWECQECHDRSRGGHPVVLNADHIKPFALFPELRFAIDNGRTLCEPCHRKTPTFGCKIRNYNMQTV